MPWYRSGNVSITNGQTTVTGTSTDFALNARVGDAFQGPDGRWYEVANIASATVLSILPAYQGPTVAAGSYGLAPMQGYVKESADALRAIVNQYGSKLAALGTTGNYDILPVSKGGTGATDAAGARTNLGLVKTTSTQDYTEGRLLRVGDHGTGGFGIPITDFSQAVNPGVYKVGSPGANGPLPWASLFTLVVYRYNDEVTQIAYEEGVAAASMYIRKRTGASAWGAWADMAPLGIGQAFKDRNWILGTNYTNATSRTIQVGIRAKSSAQYQAINLYVWGGGGATANHISNQAPIVGGIMATSALIPPGFAFSFVTDQAVSELVGWELSK